MNGTSANDKGGDKKFKYYLIIIKGRLFRSLEYGKFSYCTVFPSLNTNTRTFIYLTFE